MIIRVICVIRGQSYTMRSVFKVIDLGVKAYEPALKLQEELVEKLRNKEIPDTLLLVEHEPVYTLGINAGENNIIASKDELKRKRIKVIKTTRGGDVTFHGPGQLVGYPIIFLGADAKMVLWYVEKLEQLIIRTLADFSIKGSTDRKHRGVWVGNDKIAALGVRITRQITMHGFALNVSTDLKYYEDIIPCGIRDKGVTSLRLLGCNASMDEVKRKVVKNFKEIFSYRES